MIIPILLDIVIWSFLTDRKPTTEAQTIDCISDITSPCINTNITCDTNKDCSIHCISPSSCSYSNINCPRSGDCQVICGAKSSCQDTIIFASKSSKLNITGCTRSLCRNLAIYCPPSTNNVKNCFIAGGDDVGPGLSIYAIHGWQDIEIVGSTNLYGADNYMYCGIDYDKSCSITNERDRWQCREYQDSGHCYNDDGVVINDINTTYIIFDHAAVGHGKDPTGILWVGLFLVMLSLSWVVCAIIRYALKKSVHNRHLARDRDGNDSEDTVIEQETSDDDTEDGNEGEEGDGMVNDEGETRTIHKVADMIKLQSFSDYKGENALNMNDIDDFEFERIPNSVCE